MTNNVRMYMTLSRLHASCGEDDELAEALEEVIRMLWNRMTDHERARFEELIDD